MNGAASFGEDDPPPGTRHGLSRALAGLAATTRSWWRPTPVVAEMVAERIGDGIVRFHASAAARREADPSVAVAPPRDPLGPAPADLRERPRFERFRGRPAVSLPIAPGTSLYGLGELPGALARNGRCCRLWNSDVFGYDDSFDALYQSHPWVLAVRADGSAYGVLFDTIRRGRIDLADSIRFVGEGPWPAVIVIERDRPAAVVEALASLTGYPAMPPRWALGYHQCRWSYTPAARVLEVARGFRERHLPCEAIWLDIEYMDGYRCFTWHPRDFPDPRATLDTLHAGGFRAVAILDPGIKRDPNYSTYVSGSLARAWVEDRDAQPFVGRVWPGECVFPDFTNAGARRWWSGEIGTFLATGLDGLWIDMNEPSLFPAPLTMPPDNRHRADDDLGGPGTHARFHNIYGMEMARATYDGMAAARPARRPFVLTRANHLGGQRWAATWTGDNVSDWNHVAWSIPMALNLGLSGQPFAGPDIGGFTKEGDARLFARWMGIGTLLPFARAHSATRTRDKEPWSWGPETEATCRRALDRRYRLLPHLYTLFHHAAVTGMPVARPCFFADPRDPRLRNESDAFMLGDGLLVSCRTTPDAARVPARPAGDWHRIDLGVDDGADPELPELRLLAGAILPLGPAMEWSDQCPLDPLELVMALDGKGSATGTLYEDAGDGIADRDRLAAADGPYRLTRLAAVRRGDEVLVTTSPLAGAFEPPARGVVVRLIDPAGDRVAHGRWGETLRIPPLAPR